MGRMPSIFNLESSASTQEPSAADFPQEIQEEAERRTRGRRLRSVGISSILSGLTMMVGSLAIPLEWLPPDFQNLPSFWFYIGVMTICGGVLSLRRSRQYLAPNAEQLLERDPRPPVVYLRPFDADDIDPIPPEPGEYMYGDGTFEEAFGASEEEQLAVAMNELGPFVAIGKPYDLLPKLGAARIRVSDEQWKAKVAEWVSHAQLIVLRVGFTKGVEWEVAHIVEHVPPEKLVLLLPFTPATGYETFRERMREHFRRDLPKISRRNWTPPLSVCGLMFFSSGWEPHFVELKRPLLNRLSRVLDKMGSMWGIGILAIMGPRPLVTLILFALQPRNWVTAQYKRAFRPVIEQLGLRWKRPVFVHLLKPFVTVPLLIGFFCFLSAPIVQQTYADAIQALQAQFEHRFAKETLTASDLGVEIYPGAQPSKSVERMNLAGKSVVSAYFVTSDSKEQVIDFYKKSKFGSDAIFFEVDKGAIFNLIKSEQESVLVTIIPVSSEYGGKTQINITHTTKNKTS
ncbi:MAG: hypothetical protein ABR924_11450 [Terracidiphilus sp.]|jgi:hypothetical protein